MTKLTLDKSRNLTGFFKAQTAIFMEGEISQHLYIVKKGQVHLLKILEQRHPIAVGLCKEGEILNEVSILANKPVKYAAIAKTDVELIPIEQKDILSVIKKGPPWMSEIFKTLCERLESTIEIIEEHNLMAGEKNLDLILTQEDETKYAQAFLRYSVKVRD